MASNDQTSSQSQTDSRYKTKPSKPISINTSSGLRSEETPHNITNGNTSLSNSSQDSNTVFRAATYSTLSSNQEASHHNENCHHQELNPTTYAANVLDGAACLGIDIPPQLKEAFVDQHGKSWPDLGLCNGASMIADSSTRIEFQEMEYDSGFLGWSIDAGVIHGGIFGEDTFGVGAQFGQ